MTCPMCRDVGWVLDTKPRVEPLGLGLLPCFLPDWQWSGHPIGVLSVDGRFRDVVRHPKDGRVMSLTGFIGPASG
jgi:hypothetical protein